MRLTFLAASLAVLALAAAPAAAQPSAKSLDLARRYAKALNMEGTLVSMMGTMMPTLMDQIAQRNGGTVPPEVRSILTEVMEESTQAMTPRMIEAMLPAVAETFTEAELQAAVDYYESPLGRSFVAKSPAFMSKVTPAMSALAPEIHKDMNERLCKKVGCDPATLK